MEYDAAQFLKKISKPKPAPVALPIAATKAEPTPPTVKETKSSDKLSESDGADYLRSTGCMDDAEDFRIAAFLDACRNGYVTYGTVEEIVTNLKKPIVQPKPVIITSTISSTPREQKLVQPVVVHQAPPATTPNPEEGLPSLPDYVKRALGSNKLRNRADVRAIPSQLFSDLYKGPHAESFKARVEAAARR